MNYKRGQQVLPTGTAEREKNKQIKNTFNRASETGRTIAKDVIFLLFQESLKESREGARV